MCHDAIGVHCMYHKYSWVVCSSDSMEANAEVKWATLVEVGELAKLELN